jgi:hypothetical protein
VLVVEDIIADGTSLGSVLGFAKRYNPNFLYAAAIKCVPGRYVTDPECRENLQDYEDNLVVASPYSDDTQPAVKHFVANQETGIKRKIETCARRFYRLLFKGN